MLFHGLHAAFERDDVVLADRFYCSYWDVALRLGRGMDVVMRAPQRRAVALRRGRAVGPCRSSHRLDQAPAAHEVR